MNRQGIIGAVAFIALAASTLSACGGGGGGVSTGVGVNTGITGSTHISVPTACTDFHVYQMTWTPEKIEVGVDGTVYQTYANAHTGHDQWPFDGPQFLLLNLAIGGDWPGAVDDTIFPRTFQVDYVRVYQKP